LLQRQPAVDARGPLDALVSVSHCHSGSPCSATCLELGARFYAPATEEIGAYAAGRVDELIAFRAGRAKHLAEAAAKKNWARTMSCTPKIRAMPPSGCWRSAAPAT